MIVRSTDLMLTTRVTGSVPVKSPRAELQPAAMCHSGPTWPRVRSCERASGAFPGKSLRPRWIGGSDQVEHPVLFARGGSPWIGVGHAAGNRRVPRLQAFPGKRPVIEEERDQVGMYAAAPGRGTGTSGLRHLPTARHRRCSRLSFGSGAPSLIVAHRQNAQA